MLAPRRRQGSDDQLGEDWRSSAGARNRGTTKIGERAEVDTRCSGSDESRIRCR